MGDQCFVPVNGTVNFTTHAFIVNYSSLVAAGALGRMVDVGHDSHNAHAYASFVSTCKNRTASDSITEPTLYSNPVFIIVPIMIVAIGFVLVIIYNVKKYQAQYQTRL